MSYPQNWQPGQQQGQYPQQYPPQSPYSQPQQWYQQQWYQQYGYPQYGYPQPGHPGGPQGPKRRTGVIVGSALGGVVVLAGIVVAVLFATGVLGGQSGAAPTAHSRGPGAPGPGSAQPSVPPTSSPQTGNRDTAGGTVPIFEIQPGQCFREPGSGNISELELVPCTEPHYAEALAWVELEAGTYPGTEKLFQRVEPLCRAKTADLVRGSPIAERISRFALVPSPSEWRAGHHRALCLAGGKGGTKLRRPITG